MDWLPRHRASALPGGQVVTQRLEVVARFATRAPGCSDIRLISRVIGEQVHRSYFFRGLRD